MYGCDVVFGVGTAEKVRDEVRARMGGTCPCEAGATCPLLPTDLGRLFLTPI